MYRVQPANAKMTVMLTSEVMLLIWLIISVEVMVSLGES